MTKLEEVAIAIRDIWVQSTLKAEPWEVFARAAIEAMREPTPEMISAGFKTGGRDEEIIWKAMIDEILTEKVK